MTKPKQPVRKIDIKKGFRFYWEYRVPFSGIYEVICFAKDLSLIFCYKLIGSEATIKRDGRLAKFDERIIDNKEFKKL